MATYTVNVQEGKPSLETLSTDGYNLQVAKSVSSPNASPIFNVVYSSASLGPNMSVSWTVQYGLNWTQNVPDPGAKVTYSGAWQACSIGQSYNLDPAGEWVVNDKDPNANPNSLNVGSNGYSGPVNIVVGVQNPETQDWATIWVSPDPLVVNANGQYEPKESIQLWFSEGIQSQTMIATQATVVEDFDMTGNPVYYFQYDTATGTWKAQATPFPPSQ